MPCIGARTATVPAGRSSVADRRCSARVRDRLRLARGRARRAGRSRRPARRPGRGAVGDVGPRAVRQLAGAASSSSAMCSSTKRVSAVDGEEVGVLRARPAGRRCSSPTPSMRNSPSAAAGLGRASASRSDGGVDDDLGEQRVEVRAGAVAGVAERVGAQPGPDRRLERGEHAAGGLCRPVGPHRLHVDARLDGEAARRRHVAAGEARARPASRPAASSSCSCTRSMPVHLLGHGVLDLQARVGLDEREPCVAPRRRVSTRNSNVPRLRYPAARAIAHGRVGERGAQRRRRAPAPGRSRPASGGGAGCCSRARRGERPRRRRRRRSAPRRGARARPARST